MGIFDGFRRKRRVEEEAVASTSADRHEDRPDETGHDEPRRGPRPRVKTSPAPFGPVGLLAIQFQGCRVLVSTKTDLLTIAIVGTKTCRRTVVAADWGMDAAMTGLTAGGRYEWIRGEWVDVNRADIRDPTPSRSCLADVHDLSHLSQVFPKVSEVID